MEPISKEEYKKELDILQTEFKQKLFKLSKKVALSNAEFKIGDMVSGGLCTIKVDKIKIKWGESLPMPGCIYEGVSYTKKGLPYKSGERNVVYR